MTEKKVKILFVLYESMGSKTLIPFFCKNIEGYKSIEGVFLHIDDNIIWKKRLPRWTELSSTLKIGCATKDLVLSAYKKCKYDGVFFLNPQPAIFSYREMKDSSKFMWFDVSSGIGNKLNNPSGFKYKLTNFFSNQVWKQIYGSFDTLFPWSEWVGNDLIKRQGVFPQNIKVVRPGYDLNVWKPDYGARNSSKVKLLFVGNDLARKGAFMLIDVFLKHFSEKCELHLLTNNKNYENARKNVHIHNNFSHENVPDLVRMFNFCDVFCFPTQNEPFGLVVAEAMCCGLPIITTRDFAMPEMVKDGVNGFLVDKGDMNGLRNALEKIVGDRGIRIEMGKQSRKRAVVLFNQKANILDMFDRMVYEIKKGKNKDGF